MIASEVTTYCQTGVIFLSFGLIRQGAQMIYHFENYELDIENFELSRSGEKLELEPKVFDLLSYLVTNQKKLITKEELFEHLWPGQIVTEASLSNQISEARKILGDSGKKQAIIKTVHGRGFQFLSSVTREIIPESNESIAKATIKLLRNACPTVAVLPFVNLGDDPEQVFFCEGMSEDIITELSRFRDLRVIARYSTFHFGKNAASQGELVEKLNADYVVEGSVRKRGNSIRMNVNLTDLSDGTSIWGDKFDLGIDEVFTVQDLVVEKVVSIIAGKVKKVETAHALARKTRNISAYDHLLRGLYYHKTYWPSKDTARLAYEEFSNAVELDPELARAHAWRVCSLSTMRGDMAKHYLDEYLEITMRAHELDETEDEVQRILATCYHAMGNLDQSEFHGRMALHINPNNADVIARSAYRFACLGLPEQAEAMIERAMSINPLHPGWYWLNRGMVAYCAGDYGAATEFINRNTERNGYSLAWLAACQAADNQLDAARESAGKATELDENASVGAYTMWDNFRDPAELDSLRSHMLKAGVPD